MKRLIFLLLLFPLTTFAQKEISKKANCIIIANKNTAYANFTDARIKLTKDSIQIVDLDKDRFQIKTAVIPLKDGTMAYFNFDCRDDKITISGLWKPSLKDNYTTIEDGGAIGSTAKAAFDKMQELAKKLGKALTYEYSKYLP